MKVKNRPAILPHKTHRFVSPDLFQSRHAGVYASLHGIQSLVIELSGALLFIYLPGDER